MGLTFVDLFSGIGGFRLGLEQAGHKCLGHCEIDKYANISYAAIHQPEGEWFNNDITKVRAVELPRSDIWCFGFPCQDISTAGKQKGMREGTRSGLFFAVAKLIRETAEEDRPQYLFVENVKNLLSINGGWDFFQVLSEMDDLGYDAEWQVLNSKNFGVPQNRERVFIVGHLRTGGGGAIFPIRSNDQENDIKIVGHSGSGGERGFIHETSGIVGALSATDYKQPKQIAQLYGTANEENPSGGRVYGIEGLMRTLGTGHGMSQPFIGIATPESKKNTWLKNRQDNKVYSVKGNSPTLNICRTNHSPKVNIGYRIRRLTPKECWRLQGFPDWAFDRAREAGVSESQLYRQAGNSVTVNVIKAIGERLK